MSSLVPRERIEQTILLIRGHRVMLSTDRADLYAVEPRVLVQAVAMLSSVLRSKSAVQVNIGIMRACVRLREMIASNKGLARPSGFGREI